MVQPDHTDGGDELANDYIELAGNNTVKLGEASIQAHDLQVIDGCLVVSVAPELYDGGHSFFIAETAPQEIETPKETFTGRVRRVGIEHGSVALWIEPVEGGENNE